MIEESSAKGLLPSGAVEMRESMYYDCDYVWVIWLLAWDAIGKMTKRRLIEQDRLP